MLFRSSLYETNVDASITAALRWIQDYEAKRTPSTAFVGISVPRGIGKGATSYVLQLNGGASYILKISEPKQIYKGNLFKRHLQRLFAVVEAMDDKEAILSPIFATLRGASFCLVYVPCKTVKRKGSRDLRAARHRHCAKAVSCGALAPKRFRWFRH